MSGKIQWQPIASAPKDRDFLIHFASGYITRGRLIAGQFFAADAMPSNGDTTPTHWAEIPDPPSETG